MKRLAVLLSLISSLAFAEPVSRSVSLDAVPVAEVYRLAFGEISRVPYQMVPEVVSDQRLVSVRWDSRVSTFGEFLKTFSQGLGYEVASVGGMVVVRPQRQGEEVEDVFVYRPKHRDGSYLSDLVQPLFKGKFTLRRSIQGDVGGKADQKAVPPGSAAALIERKGTDMLVFGGTTAEVERLKKLFTQVDVPVGEVLVRAALYEVRTSRTEGSAFKLVASLLSGKLGITVGAVTNALSNSVSYKGTMGGISLDAVLSALNTDNRFRMVSSPYMRLPSGENGRLSVGQDVPVLGAVTFAQGASQPVQSVEYKPSGMIFDVSPQIRESEVALKVRQEISGFVPTDTGVNQSPTLIKRQMETSATLADGELMVVGGLQEGKSTTTESGLSFLPRFMRSNTDDSQNSEIVLFLQVQRL